MFYRTVLTPQVETANKDIAEQTNFTLHDGIKFDVVYSTLSTTKGKMCIHVHKHKHQKRTHNEKDNIAGWGGWEAGNAM